MARARGGYRRRHAQFLLGCSHPFHPFVMGTRTRQTAQLSQTAGPDTLPHNVSRRNAKLAPPQPQSGVLDFNIFPDTSLIKLDVKIPDKT